jgi:hypothetical protein
MPDSVRGGVIVRTLRRIIPSALNLLSILPLLAIVALWVATYAPRSVVGLARLSSQRDFKISCCQGYIGAEWIRHDFLGVPNMYLGSCFPGHPPLLIDNVAHGAALKSGWNGSFVFWHGRYRGDHWLNLPDAAHYNEDSPLYPPFVTVVQYKGMTCLLTQNEPVGGLHLLSPRSILGVYYASIAFVGRFNSRLTALTIPLWLLAALAACLPGARIARRSLRSYHKRRRERGGLCSVCGYDLRASPSRCPECGSLH